MNHIKSIIIMFLLSFLGVGTISAEDTANTDTEYKYTISATSGLGTLCFPATVTFWTDDAEKELIGFRAFTVTGCQNDVLTLSEISRSDEDSAIPANTPVILYWPGGGTVDCGTIPTIYTPQDIDATQENLLGGTTKTDGYSITGAAGSNYYIMQNHSGNIAFYQCSGKNNDTDYYIYKVGRFRCWLDMSNVNGAKPASLSFFFPEEETTTGINTVKTTSLPEGEDWGEANGIYTLSGTRVDHPVHGEIYIMVMDGRSMKFTLSKSNGLVIK